MIARTRSACRVLAVFCLTLAGCSSAPGRPKPGPEVPRPDAVMDFPTLYRQNCAGCHGATGMNGPSYPLGNPEYQALVDDQTLRQTISQGEPGTMMPAFAIEAGGTLTDAQVNALVAGMRAAWSKPGVFAGATAPPYHSAVAGDPAKGQQVYGSYCASCHGSSSQPGGKAGSILNPAFLALVSDQALRTVVIAGRPDLGQPDWRGDLPGHAMSDEQVSDVVAWIASRRHPAPAGVASAQSANAAPPAKQAAKKDDLVSGHKFLRAANGEPGLQPLRHGLLYQNAAFPPAKTAENHTLNESGGGTE
jgi:cytochrome c oxidase cbb3-type subunit III